MCKKSVVLAVCLCALLIGQSAFAYVIVADTFTQTETRIAGGALDGTFTEVGNLEWYNRTDRDYYMFNDPDGIPGNADDNIKRAYSSYRTMWVSLVDYVPAPAGETMTVSGDFNFPATNADNGGLVFYPSGSNVSGLGLNLDSCSFAVMIYNQATDINEDGVTEENARLLCFNSEGIEKNLVATVPSIYSNVGMAAQTMVVEYDTTTGILNATVNGDAMFTNIDLPGLFTSGSMRDIAYAGFLIRERGAALEFDNYKLESSVPEPATLILLSLGGLGLLRRRK